jgi:hypothetical protein
MNSYRFSAPRIALGFVAAAMTTLTMGAMVVLPALLENESRADAVFAASPHVDELCVAALRASSQPSESH